MRVRLVDPETGNLLQVAGQQHREQIFCLFRICIQMVTQSLALLPAGNQNPFRAQPVDQIRNTDAVMMGLAGKAPGIGGLVTKIQFHGSHDQQLLDGLFEIELTESGRRNRRQNLKYLCILLEQLADTGQAHFHGHIRAILQACAMHLSYGCYRHRGFFNPAKPLTPVPAPGFPQHLFDACKGNRRRVILQRLKRFNIFLRQHVRSATEELGRLDPERPITTTQSRQDICAPAMPLMSIVLANPPGIDSHHTRHGCQGT